MTKGEIAVGESESWTGEQLYIPPLPPSDLPNCDIIDISYSVVVSAAWIKERTNFRIHDENMPDMTEIYFLLD